LYSIVTLTAHRLQSASLSTRSAAWYAKRAPTFSDALACVRRELWQAQSFATSHPKTDSLKIPRPLLDQLTETLCYAA
jgi:hypothetical protein